MTATQHQPCHSKFAGQPGEGDITEFITPRLAACAVQRARRYGISHVTVEQPGRRQTDRTAVII